MSFCILLGHKTQTQIQSNALPKIDSCIKSTWLDCTFRKRSTIWRLTPRKNGALPWENFYLAWIFFPWTIKGQQSTSLVSYGKNAGYFNSCKYRADLNSSHVASLFYNFKAPAYYRSRQYCEFKEFHKTEVFLTIP